MITLYHHLGGKLASHDVEDLAEVMELYGIHRRAAVSVLHADGLAVKGGTAQLSRCMGKAAVG